MNCIKKGEHAVPFFCCYVTLYVTNANKWEQMRTKYFALPQLKKLKKVEK